MGDWEERENPATAMQEATAVTNKAEKPPDSKNIHARKPVG